MWQYRQTNELYHYGVPGMRWGVKKAKYEAKAEAYRKAASNATGKKQEKLTAKADKYDARAKSLDTKKGRAAETARDVAKVGAIAAAAAIGVIGAMKLSHVKGFKNGETWGKQKVLKFLDNEGEEKLARIYQNVYMTDTKRRWGNSNIIEKMKYVSNATLLSQWGDYRRPPY